MDIEYLTVEHLTTKDLIRLFSKISIDPSISFNGTPCWTWKAGTDEKGYGVFWYGKHQKAHRFLFAWLVHPLPVGQKNGEMDHLCRRQQCCNPLHLEFVNASINAQRKPLREYCQKNLHRLEGDNVIVYSNGTRGCRACRTIRTKEQWKNSTPQTKAEHYNRVREWRSANFEHVREQARTYSKKESAVQRRREYQQNNRERLNAIARISRANNRDQINERQRRWRQEHPEEYRAQNKRNNDRAIQRRRE